MFTLRSSTTRCSTIHRAAAITSMCALLGLSACNDVDDDARPLPVSPSSSTDHRSGDQQRSADTGPVGPLAGKDVAAPQAAPPGDDASNVVAVAHIEPVSGAGDDNKVTGSIHFAPTTTGLELSGRLMNLATGKHGAHIHTNGSCDDPGEHFAPESKLHGDPKQGEHHLGDLGNVEADSANEAWISINVQGLTLRGDRSILGHTLVVHAAPDDLKTQPSGNSGDVIACGVIEPEGDAEVRPESQATVPATDSATAKRSG